MSVHIKKNASETIDILMLLWGKRRRIITNCVIAGVVSIIIAFSIPKQYTSTVVMAPEMSTGQGLSGNLGTLASMAGVNIGNIAGGEDALHPEIYPQIVSSTPFLLDVLSEQVESNDGEIKATLYDYLANHQKTTWWSKIFLFPISFIERLFTDEEEEHNTLSLKSTQQMKLSKRQFAVLTRLEKSIGVSVDKGNFVITLNVTMQDQKIAAYLTNVVSEKLQDYIIEYRSAKARKDLEYFKGLYDESKKKYYEIQNAYADYVSQHQNVINMRFQVEMDRLENEKELAYGIYNQMAQNYELARVKLQEETPVCVVVEPAYIQIKASSPKKMMIGLLFVFLAFFGTAMWIIVKDRIVDIRK